MSSRWSATSGFGRVFARSRSFRNYATVRSAALSLARHQCSVALDTLNNLATSKIGVALARALTVCIRLATPFLGGEVSCANSASETLLGSLGCKVSRKVWAF
jgi:hypothetical protein